MQASADLARPGTTAPRRRISTDETIRLFFGSNALVAIVVLALITLFLCREGFGFFGQNLANIRLYRQSGQEFVDVLRKHADAHAALARGLNSIRAGQLDEFATAFSDTAE